MFKPGVRQTGANTGVHANKDTQQMAMIGTSRISVYSMQHLKKKRWGGKVMG